MLDQFLQEIGLTNSEIKVYLALTELGSSTAGPIIEASQIASSKIYEVLEKLGQKGLVSMIESGGVRYFQAAPPERIKEYLTEKAQTLKKQTDQFEKILPSLQYNNKLPKTKATIYSGIKGVQTALFAQLDKDPDSISIRGNLKAGPALEPILERFISKCADAENNTRILTTTQTPFPVPTKQLTHQAPSITITFDDCVIILPEYSKDPIAITINAKDVAKSFQAEFDDEWTQETKVMYGFESVEYLMELVLKNGGVDWIGARGYFVDANKEYTTQWEKRAIKQKIKTRNIIDPAMKGHKVTKWPFAKTKYTLKKEFAMMSCFWIFKDKVAITNYLSGKPMVLLIENKSYCEMYKKQFESLWNKS